MRRRNKTWPWGEGPRRREGLGLLEQLVPAQSCQKYPACRLLMCSKSRGSANLNRGHYRKYCPYGRWCWYCWSDRLWWCPPSLRWGTREFVAATMGSHSSASPVKSFPGHWREESSWLLNLKSRRNNAALAKRWGSTSLLQRAWACAQVNHTLSQLKAGSQFEISLLIQFQNDFLIDQLR